MVAIIGYVQNLADAIRMVALGKPWKAARTPSSISSKAKAHLRSLVAAEPNFAFRLTGTKVW